MRKEFTIIGNESPVEIEKETLSIYKWVVIREVDTWTRVDLFELYWDSFENRYSGKEPAFWGRIQDAVRHGKLVIKH